MIEIAQFKPEEIDDAITAMDTFQDTLVPFFKKVNFEGLGEKDAQDFVRAVTLSKHALIAMGDFLEKKMKGGKMTNGDKIRALSDEQLADLIAVCPPGSCCLDCMRHIPCKQCRLEWMKEEVAWNG